MQQQFAKACELFNTEKDFKHIDPAVITEEANKMLHDCKPIKKVDELFRVKKGAKYAGDEVVTIICEHFYETALKVLKMKF